MSKQQSTDVMEKLVSLCKRRGFVFPSGERYGGLQGFWDWGPLGVEFKNNIKREWWQRFVHLRSDVVGLDSAIITNPTVWQKSGHVQNFADELVECKKCHHRFKRDDVGASCPDCGGAFTDPRSFKTMFRTFVGPAEDSAHEAYLRPETAQNIFVNYETVRESMRMKLPFGIAQIGKAFRNEITPGNFFFRSREFEQMELEFFTPPNDDTTWFDYWVKESKQWFLDHGIKADHLREYHQKQSELAHYAKQTTDLEFLWPFTNSGSAQGGDKGWGELTGVANRGNFDLSAHGITPPKGEELPYVIEPSFGVERAALAFLVDAYEEIAGGRTTTTESVKEQEVVLRLHPTLAPIKVAILPLSKKEPLTTLAQELLTTVHPGWSKTYDETGSIGKRYRRQDEIGTPYCVTVDFDSLEDRKVTVRNRDTMAQERVAIPELAAFLSEKFSNA